MKKQIIIITTILAALLFAATAQADVFTFEDTAITWPGWENGSSEDGKDIIGVPNFTSGSITYTGNTMTGFSINLTANNSVYNTLTSGDLFINIDNDQTWDYVVDLSGRHGGVANVYAFNVDYDDASSYYMSWASGDYRDDHPVGAKVDGLDPVAQVMWSGMPNYPFGPTGTITISGLDIDFEMLTVAYTISCANDVVFASGLNATPIPGAAWLLGSGLFGLVGLKSRFKK
ncbi:MAG: hypothetical protein AB7D51_12695 [Desulfovibrionaceae bacterium]